VESIVDLKDVEALDTSAATTTSAFLFSR